MELVDLFERYEFQATISGSALMALEGKDDNELGVSAVETLVGMRYIQAERGRPAVDADEDVFSIAGRGTVVTGRASEVL